jgi:hypothetical protein
VETGPVQVREDLREPIRPLPPSRPYFPLILLAAVGLLVAGGLVGATFYFTRRPRPLPEVASEGVRAKRREPEPVLSIREIPVLPPPPKPTPIVVDPSTVPPLIPVPPADLASPLAKSQQLGARANLCGIVQTILELTGKLEEARQVEAELARLNEEIRALLAPLGDRPEARTVDYFKPGDEIRGFGIVERDPLHPLLFAEAIRGWLSEAQRGALAVATIDRDGRTFTLSMWFPDFPSDLTRRVIPLPSKPPK